MARKRVKRINIWHSTDTERTQVSFDRTDGDGTYHGRPYTPGRITCDRLDKAVSFGDSPIIFYRTIFTYPDYVKVSYNFNRLELKGDQDE